MIRHRQIRTAVGLLAFAVLALFAQAAFSQATRTVKIIVPYTPASGPDILGPPERPSSSRIVRAPAR